MSFASAYIGKQVLFPKFTDEEPDHGTSIIVVVPSYAETEIKCLLDSLHAATRPQCSVEVIIVINAPGDASEDLLLTNRKTAEDIESWKKQNYNCWFRLFYFTVQPGAISDWGVGLARKTGMDEAVRRYNSFNNPGGLIVSLDADCTVRENYFTAICNEFFMINKRKACSIYFEHDTTGERYSKETCSNIILYELHLRYLLQGQRYAGFPWAFHTVGSSMAVRAGEYVAAGGMNRRQAGEDFYFIQKLADSGGYFSLNSTAVYPSPRISFRVPFGTGAAMGKLEGGKEKDYLTYNIRAFEDLKVLFPQAGLLFRLKGFDLVRKYNDLPVSIRRFIQKDEWVSSIEEINNNTSSLQSFNKRFFRWFNMFRIVRYLNYVHDDIYEKMPVNEAAAALLRNLGVNVDSDDPEILLNVFREMERNF